MKDLEFNKIAAAVLVAGLLAIGAGKISTALYQSDTPNGEEAKRGYQVEAAAASSGASSKEKKKDKPIDIAAYMAAADASRGETGFRKCSACHTVDAGGAHRVGPNLSGVVGKDIGKASGYSYSKSMAAFGGKWTEHNLAQFLKKPRKYVPGTKMGFAGIRKPEDIADMIAYLKKK